MGMLEDFARNQGYSFFVLESGEPLVVMKLYYSTGYKVISNYGPYMDMKDCIYMRKAL